MVHFSRSANAANPGWTMHADGREALRWPRLSTGPLVLSQDRLEDLADRLLGVRLAEVPDLVSRVIRYVQADEADRSTLVLHGATSAKRDFECAVTDLLAGREPTDLPGFLETRAVALAGSGDLVVGRIASWREAARFFGVPALDLEDTDHYYLSHAILNLVSDNAAASRSLLDWVSAHPDCVVRPYAFDLEIQLLVLWMIRRLGLPHLTVDANAPSVSTHWSQKSCLHPEVARAAALAADGLSALETLRLERSHSPLSRVLRIELPTLPGYTVVRGARTEREFGDELLAAGRLLRTRYGLNRGCLKPSQGGGGIGIVSGLGLAERDLLAAAAQAYPYGGDCVLEADVVLSTFDVAGQAQKLSPSGHVRGGRVAPGMTAQFLDGHTWMGNVYFDASTAAQFHIPPDLYHGMRAALSALHRGLSADRTCGPGFVTGGVDFLVGQLGGRFGDQPTAAVVDLNLSHHGGEYLRSFLEDIASGGRYVATRVFRPSPRATLAETAHELSRSTSSPERSRLIGCIPGDWGMLAITGSTPLDAAQQAFALVDVLEGVGLTAR